MTPRLDRVVIVGGGFAGTLLAINLLRHDGPAATLIERRPLPARGTAYSAAHPDHLLNVRAANMSALPDDPGHFARWLEARGDGCGATGFAPRLTYGDYLGELLDEARGRWPGRLRTVRAEAADVAAAGDGVRVTLDDGSVETADAAVLALGNLPPHAPARLAETLPAGAYVGDPWAPGLAAGLREEDTVAVLGTGLTMVDVALLLDAEGFRGRIVALSRRGLLPRAHAPLPPPPAAGDRPPAEAVALLRHVRARAAAIGWRLAVDELRPVTQQLWRAADEGARRRFLRHLRPWWDVHRHRLAPVVAERIAALRGAGRLEVRAGSIRGGTVEGGRVALRYRPRGSEGEEVLHAARVVNATGPLGDVGRATSPLLRALVDRGTLRADPLRIGIDVTHAAELIAADGTVSPRLRAIGPMTRGTFWEIVAVPDIRRQAWDVARDLSHARWVGGEGL